MGKFRDIWRKQAEPETAVATQPAPAPAQPAARDPAPTQPTVGEEVETDMPARVPQHVIGSQVVSTEALPPQMERAVSALVQLAHSLDTRLGLLEAQMLEGNPNVAASKDDIIALKLENARLSAELAKTSIDLRTRIDDVEFNNAPASMHDKRVAKLAEQIIDLSDAYNHQPAVDAVHTPMLDVMEPDEVAAPVEDSSAQDAPDQDVPAVQPHDAPAEEAQEDTGEAEPEHSAGVREYEVITPETSDSASPGVYIVVPDAYDEIDVRKAPFKATADL